MSMSRSGTNKVPKYYPKIAVMKILKTIAEKTLTIGRKIATSKVEDT